MLPIFLLAGVPNVLGHGGMVWPPIWQDGNALPLDEVWNNRIQGNPPIEDPATGKLIDNAKSWLTDQSYTGGHGEFPNGTSYHEGPSYEPNWDNLQYISGDHAWQCWKNKRPWAAPGRAPELVKVAASMAATPTAVLSTVGIRTTVQQAPCACQTQTSIVEPGRTAAEPST